jgi:hypothetical protein
MQCPVPSAVTNVPCVNVLTHLQVSQVVGRGFASLFNSYSGLPSSLEVRGMVVPLGMRAGCSTVRRAAVGAWQELNSNPLLLCSPQAGLDHGMHSSTNTCFAGACTSRHPHIHCSHLMHLPPPYAAIVLLADAFCSCAAGTCCHPTTACTCCICCHRSSATSWHWLLA